MSTPSRPTALFLLLHTGSGCPGSSGPSVFGLGWVLSEVSPERSSERVAARHWDERSTSGDIKRALRRENFDSLDIKDDHIDCQVLVLNRRAKLFGMPQFGPRSVP